MIMKMNKVEPRGRSRPRGLADGARRGAGVVAARRRRGERSPQQSTLIAIYLSISLSLYLSLSLSLYVYIYIHIYIYICIHM